MSKLSHIKVLLHDSGKNTHALGITESKLNNSVGDVELHIEGYVKYVKIEIQDLGVVCVCIYGMICLAKRN